MRYGPPSRRMLKIVYYNHVVYLIVSTLIVSRGLLTVKRSQARTTIHVLWVRHRNNIVAYLTTGFTFTTSFNIFIAVAARAHRRPGVKARGRRRNVYIAV
jgi:hypothetical protein